MAIKKENRWQALLDLVAIEDALPVRASGYWAEDKLYFWNRYVEITTTAMVDKPLYFDQPDSNLDLVLGMDSEWRQRKADLGTADGARTRQLYADIYKDQLRRHCGYAYFGEEVISGASGPLYRLVYATKHETGLRFWNESIKRESGGQIRWF